MSAKTARSGDNARTAAQQSSSKDVKQKVPKQLIERIKEATGATDEVIVHTLEECNGDPNEATTRLIENPFTEFTTKAKRKQQRADSAKDNKVIEVRRAGSVSGGTRGGRGSARGDRQSTDRPRSGRGAPRSADSSYKPPAEGWGTSASATDEWDEPQSVPLAAPSPSRPSASPAVASTTPVSVHPEPVRPSWGRPGAPGTGTMADLLKRPPPAATAPPPEGQLPPSAPDEKQEIVGSLAPPGPIVPPNTQLHDTPPLDSATAPPEPAPQSLGALPSSGLPTLSSNSMPSSYPNAPQPIGPPSGSVSHSTAQSSSQDQPMHKTSTSDLGGVAVDPPARPNYTPQQDLHTNGSAQHDAWGTSKPSASASGSAAAQSGQGLSQQGNFGPPSQHQGTQPNLGPSLLSSLNAQSSSGPSTSAALHSLSNMSTPSMSAGTSTEPQGHTNFQQDRSSQYSILPQVDQMQMQFGQVQLNGNDFGSSGFGTGFGPSSSQGQTHDSSSAHLEDMPFLRQQSGPGPQQQPHAQGQSQQQSQQSSQVSSDAGTSTADGLIQQHRPSSEFQSGSANRGYGAFPQSHAQPTTSRAVPAASQAHPASVSAGIQTEASSLGNTSGQGYGSYGSAQGMGGFANQQSQYSQTPQYQSYGDSSAGGTPTGGVASSKQPSYDTYSSNYGNSFAQPSFGGQKSDLYSGHSGHAAQSQVSLPRYGNQHHGGVGSAQSAGLHAQSAAASLPRASSAALSASSGQAAPQLPQMPYAGPGGLPPSMGQYGNHSQTPPYSYMNPQAAYFNPMGSTGGYGGYPQGGSSAYSNPNATGFSGNSGYQSGGYPKYPGYSNHAYGASNGYDDSSSGYGKDRDNMYGNHQHGHGHNPNHSRLPQDPYNAYNHYKQPGHAAGYGHQHQFGGYNQQNQHTPGSYHGANSQTLNGGGGFGRLP